MAIQTRLIEYRHGDDVLEGFFAWDDAVTGPRPAVAIAHAWGGRSEFEDQKAVKLAELGYVGFAMDMYGKGVLGNGPEENTALMTPFMQDRALLQARIARGVDVLRQQPEVDDRSVAAMGFCFGGLCVLDLARSGSDVLGVVSFHGSLKTQHQGNITSKTKVLVCNGADDPFVTAEQISSFKTEMQSSKIDYKFKNYAGAKHAFTNPAATELGKKFNIPLAYNENADKQSWNDMKAFFDSLFD